MGNGPVEDSASEPVHANDHISLPSIPIASQRLMSRDQVPDFQPAWSSLADGHILSAESNVAQTGTHSQYHQLHLDAMADVPNEMRKLESVESGPSANVGSLRLDTGGRSRYFGPTAASQWLRDVSQVYSICPRRQSQVCDH